MAQVLSNLLNNAAKYTDEGGEIALIAEREGREVAIRVRDNGTGIAPELLPHIFDMFTQADQTLSWSTTIGAMPPAWVSSCAPWGRTSRWPTTGRPPSSWCAVAAPTSSCSTSA